MEGMKKLITLLLVFSSDAWADKVYSPKGIKKNIPPLVKDVMRKKICVLSEAGEVCKMNQGDVLMDFLPTEALKDQWMLQRFLQKRNIEKDPRQLEDYKKGRVKSPPWSGYYWPLAFGGAGYRYQDPNFPAVDEETVGIEKVTYVDSYQWMSKNLGKASSLDLLSPTEKYDLLVEDPHFRLTKSSWLEGMEYQKAFGYVEQWMGLCDGWALASITLPEPIKGFSVKAAGLNFFEDDIEALATLVWAKVPAPKLAMGGRCNDKSPAEDENGRIRSPSCFDIHPGSFHLALIHRVGVDKKSFIFDATFDHEVWNQPVLGYEFEYFNVKTKKNSADLKKAMVEKKDWKKDPYAPYRAEETQYILGIELSLEYVVEVDPRWASDPHAETQTVVATYRYDLELDGDYQIIGGEWHQKNHPDFIWRPQMESLPLTNIEAHTVGGPPEWRGEWPLNTWFKVGSGVTSPQAQPLSSLIKTLIEQASQR